MKWSWKIARIADIDFFVHATFFILILWIGLSYWQIEGTWAAVINGVGFILVLFACVVAHEFGHAMMARRYGIRTKHITLLPIGGVAMLERMPEDPKQEIAVALAGPAVNLVIALTLWLWLSASGALVPAEQLNLTDGPFLERVMVINIILAVFNMLPAFPMDGGRVLRAALALRVDRNRATQTAARVGQGLALAMGLLGLLYNPFLIFIALFVWIGASAEAGMEQVKSLLTGSDVRHAMLTDYQTLTPGDPLSRAIDLTMAGSQTDFPVLEGGVMAGVLGQSDLLKGLQAQGEQSPVSGWMKKNVQNADIHEPLEAAMERLQSCDCRLISITDAQVIVGIINLDNIMELVRIQSALRERSHAE